MNLKMENIFSAIKSQHIHYTTTVYSYSNLIKINNLILKKCGKLLTIIRSYRFLLVDKIFVGSIIRAANPEECIVLMAEANCVI